MADYVAIGTRALSSVVALQAAGAAFYLWLFDDALKRSSRAIRVLAWRLTVMALLLAIAQQLVEPARLAGSLMGIFDSGRQALLLHSDAGTTTSIRVLGLMIIAASISHGTRPARGVALIGAALVALSFAFMGHTAAADDRWLLAPLLIIHLVIVAFWFGALLPLHVTCRRETHQVSSSIVKQFSTLATWSVPIIAVAGIVMAVLLLPSVSSITTPYGLSLTAKLAGFLLLMVAAGLNKYRFAPGIGRGEPGTLTALQVSMFLEWVVIACIIVVTTIMTAAFSPGH